MPRKPPTQHQSDSETSSLQRLRSDGKRGQLILLTAVIIGFLLIGFAALFSNGVRIEKLESEPVLKDPNRLAEAKDVTQREIGRLILRVNNHEYSNPVGRTNQITKNASEQLVVNTVESTNSVLELSNVTSVSGRVIRQQTEAQITDRDGHTDWRAGVFNEVRRFQFNVTRSSLRNIPDNRLDDQSYIRSNAFHLLFIGDQNTELRFYVFRHGRQVTVAKQINDSAIRMNHQSVGSANIGFIAGTMNGRDILEFPSRTTLEPPYTVEVRNGDEMSGIYTMTIRGTVNRSSVSPNRGTNGGGGGNGNGNGNGNNGNGLPYDTTAVYKTELTLQYRSPSYEMSTDMVVKPCSARSAYCLPEGNATDVRPP